MLPPVAAHADAMLKSPLVLSTPMKTDFDQIRPKPETRAFEKGVCRVMKYAMVAKEQLCDR
jgi:hypothetical protein